MSPTTGSTTAGDGAPVPPTPPPLGPPAPPTGPQVVFPPPATPLGRSLPTVAGIVLATAVLADLATRTRASGVAAVAAIWCLCAGLALAGRVRRPGGRLLLGAAALVSIFLALRASSWLIALDLVTVTALVGLACSSERDRRRFDTRFAGATRRLAATLRAVVVAPPRLLELVLALVPRRGPSADRRIWALLRGLLLAAPVVVLIGLVLAWADPVFASIFDLQIDLAPLWVHLVTIAALTWLVTGFFVQASWPPIEERPSTLSIGPVEGLVVMSGLTGLYAVFAASQLLVARRGAQFVLDTTGMTYAEYARSGFFQLLWVAGLTVVVLIVLRSVVRRPGVGSRRLFALLGTAAAALTLVIVHAALLRLQLYDDVFGLTRLRFFSSAVAWWLGAVFVLVGVAMAASTRPRRDWLPSAVGLVSLVAVVALNVVSPDRVIAERNVDRAVAGEEFDVIYATKLSSDATPVLVDALGLVEGIPRRVLAAELCYVTDTSSPTGWNRSLQLAAQARRAHCPG